MSFLSHMIYLTTIQGISMGKFVKQNLGTFKKLWKKIPFIICLLQNSKNSVMQLGARKSPHIC